MTLGRDRTSTIGSTHNICSSIALTRQVEGARSETGKDFDQIFEEPKLQTASAHHRASKEVRVQNPQPFGPHPGLYKLDEQAELAIRENSPYPFASEVEKPVPA